MSLYHEAAAVLSQSASEGGSLKSRIYGKKDLKSPPAQLYALALESCKWSGVLKEVIEASGILQHERKVSPLLFALRDMMMISPWPTLYLIMKWTYD